MSRSRVALAGTAVVLVVVLGVGAFLLFEKPAADGGPRETTGLSPVPPTKRQKLDQALEARAATAEARQRLFLGYAVARSLYLADGRYADEEVIARHIEQGLTEEDGTDAVSVAASATAVERPGQLALLASQTTPSRLVLAFQPRGAHGVFTLSAEGSGEPHIDRVVGEDDRGNS